MVRLSPQSCQFSIAATSFEHRGHVFESITRRNDLLATSCRHPRFSPRHPTRRQQTDGTATIAAPSSFRPAGRHSVRSLPSRTQNNSAQSGRTAGAQAKSNAYRPAGSKAPQFSFVVLYFLALHFYCRVSDSALLFLPTLFAINSSARPTSLTTVVNSTVSTLFLGLMTTSTASAPFSAALRWRTASRRRRLIWLRCTAPPRTLPTVKPIRELAFASAASLAEAATARGR